MGMEPLELISSSNEELPRRNLKAVGPMGWLADKGGRLTTPLGPPTFSFFGWAALGVHLSMVKVWALVMLNFFSRGPFDPCEARVTVFDRTASCSLAEKGMIALHFQLKPALIEI
jgi:hypothetical protein